MTATYKQLKDERLLLDTHTLIWFADGNPRLPTRLAEVIGNSTACYISRVSLWEVAIKVSVGKMEIKPSYAAWLHEIINQHFIVLEINNAHLETYADLPVHHRDPFDRLLIAQAITEDLTLLSRDAHFAAYPVRVQW